MNYFFILVVIIIIIVILIRKSQKKIITEISEINCSEHFIESQILKETRKIKVYEPKDQILDCPTFVFLLDGENSHRSILKIAKLISKNVNMLKKLWKQILLTA